jgi:3',5'-cyclic AMP phosphodiesterase CpdA
MTAAGFTFVQISDLQFGMLRPGADDYDETPLVERAVARINAIRPAFVICNGDLVDEPCSERQFAVAERLLEGLAPGLVCHTVPGNHDIGDAPDADAIAWFRDRIGPDRFAFDHGGWHFVGLNSCLLADGGRAPDEVRAQWQWLAADLARHRANGGGPALVFMHHPPFLDRAAEPDDYFNLPGGVRTRLLDLLQAHGVTVVLTGHLHRNNLARENGLTVVTSGPVGMPLQDGVSGLRIVKVAGDAVDHRYFALDDVEGQERFAGSA